MLFILRKIRRKLMQKNKFTTYLLYAIGEIVLVVIGILIAVSINNANQPQINKEKEQVFLSRLKEEAEWNIAVLDKQIASYRSRSETLDSVAYMLTQDLSIPKGTKITAAPYFISAWQLRKSAYTELVSSGSLSILSDLKLREILDETASFQTITVQTLEYWRGMSIEDASVFRPYRIEKDSNDGTTGMTLDFEAMKGDKEVIGGFLFWGSANLQFANGMEEFKQNYHRITERIECLENQTCND